MVFYVLSTQTLLLFLIVSVPVFFCKNSCFFRPFSTRFHHFITCQEFIFIIDCISIIYKTKVSENKFSIQSHSFQKIFSAILRLTAEAGEIYKFDEMKKCMIFMLVVSLCAVVLFGCRFLGITTLGIRQHYDDLSKEEQSLVVWTQPEEFM